MVEQRNFPVFNLYRFKKNTAFPSYCLAHFNTIGLQNYKKQKEILPEQNQKQWHSLMMTKSNDLSEEQLTALISSKKASVRRCPPKQLFSEIEEPSEKEALQKKEKSHADSGNGGGDIPPYDPNNNKGENNILNILQRRHKEATKDQQPKQYKRFEPKNLTPRQFRKVEPFQLSQSPAYQRSLGQEKPVQKKASTNGLPEEVQAKMENSMGHDFSNVNIHKESSSATDAGALAYAQGNDVHFAPGQFKPNTTSGQELIGHELAHVVQQREGRVQPTKTLGKGMAVNDDAGLEKEADEMGRKAANNNNNTSTIEGLKKRQDVSKVSVQLQRNWVRERNGDLSFGSRPEALRRMERLIRNGGSRPNYRVRNNSARTRFWVEVRGRNNRRTNQRTTNSRLGQEMKEVHVNLSRRQIKIFSRSGQRWSERTISRVITGSATFPNLRGRRKVTSRNIGPTNAHQLFNFVGVNGGYGFHSDWHLNSNGRLARITPLGRSAGCVRIRDPRPSRRQTIANLRNSRAFYGEMSHGTPVVTYRGNWRNPTFNSVP